MSSSRKIPASEIVHFAPLSLTTVCDLVECLYGIKVNNIRELNGYEDRNFYIRGIFAVKDSSNNNNISCNEDCENLLEEEFVIKVVNPKDSQDTDLLHAQCLAMNVLIREGLNCSQPIFSLQGNYHEMIKVASTPNKNMQYQNFALRVFYFVQGKMLADVPQCTVDLIFSAGSLTARLDRSLRNFYHHSLDRNNYIWDLRNISQMKHRSYVIKKSYQRKLVHDVIDQFCSKVLPKLHKLPLTVIHGDVNEQNLLVTKQSVTGIIDFAHLMNSYRVFEVSIATAYMMIEYYPKDPFEASGHFLAAYHLTYPLTRQELRLVSTVAATRLAQSLIMGAYTHSLDPNNTYVLTTQKHGWPVLEILNETPQQEILTVWKKVFESRNIEWPKK